MATVNIKVLSREKYKSKFAYAIQVLTDQNEIKELYLSDRLLEYFQQGLFYRLVACNSFIVSSTNMPALKATPKTRVSSILSDCH